MDGSTVPRYDLAMRLARLPGWVVDNATSVRREVSGEICTSMSERWAVTQRACRAARAVLRFQPDPRRVLAQIDPLPDSTVRALERLRAQRQAR